MAATKITPIANGNENRRVVAFISHLRAIGIAPLLLFYTNSDE
jgi:hypothetical protein